MKKTILVLMVVAVALMQSGSIHAKETEVKVGINGTNDFVVSVWTHDDFSPYFEITGLAVANNVISVYGIGGYITKDMTVLGVTYSDAKNAFLVTYALKSAFGEETRAIFLDPTDQEFVRFVVKIAKRWMPTATLNNPRVELKLSSLSLRKLK